MTNMVVTPAPPSTSILSAKYHSLNHSFSHFYPIGVSSNPIMINHRLQRPRNQPPETSWVEKCLGCTCLQLFWPRVVIRKWLNISAKSSDYSADSDDSVFDLDGEGEFCYWPNESRFKDKKGEDFQGEPNGAFPRSRRRKSETFRAQYIDAKEIRVSVNTWNVGGKFPPEDLDIGDWLDTDYPADIYVIGFQEIIPLNAGNIFGAEDTRPIPMWEKIIRETLNKVQPIKTKFKCNSDPPSPSRYEPSDDAPNIEDEVVLESDGEAEEINTFNEESNFDELRDDPVGQNCCITENYEEKVEESAPINYRKLTKLLSGTERIGLSWPEQPLDLLAHVSEIPNSFKFIKSFEASKSFGTFRSLGSYLKSNNRIMPKVDFPAKVDLDSIMYRKRRSQYVRIVSKQMVGVFLTIWVRRSLRKHVQNVQVSTVGVGVMGYIGNKGSISVSMSIYQTLFCFICTHLTSGERDVDAIKRNADVHEIHKRTRFNSMSKAPLPKSIEDHERIIWLGDLNYRINLSYEETCDLISKNDLSRLLESDQLGRELRKGRGFDGWREGTLNFPPTYKYEPNSQKYYGEDPNVGRRTPAWCDRILSYGKGMKQLSYKTADLRLSDHRPVSASYMVDVEVFSPRKLQRALTFTKAEVQNDGIIAEMVVD